MLLLLLIRMTASCVHSNLDITNKSVRPFLFTISNNSLYQINMLSKTSKWDLGFCSLYREIHYIKVCYIKVWVYIVYIRCVHLKDSVHLSSKVDIQISWMHKTWLVNLKLLSMWLKISNPSDVINFPVRSLHYRLGQDNHFTEL